MHHLWRSGFSPYSALPVEEVPGALPTPNSALATGSGETGWQREGTCCGSRRHQCQGACAHGWGRLGGRRYQCEPDAPNSPLHVSLTVLPWRRPEITVRAVPSPAPRRALVAHCPGPPGFGASGRLSPPLAARANGAACLPAPPCAGQWHQLFPPAAPGRTGKNLF